MDCEEAGFGFRICRIELETHVRDKNETVEKMKERQHLSGRIGKSGRNIRASQPSDLGASFGQYDGDNSDNLDEKFDFIIFNG